MPSIWDIAKITIQDLRSLGYNQICLVGTAAAALHGSEQIPQELDILVLESTDSEESIWAKLISVNPALFIAAPPHQGNLVSPKHLWYDLYRRKDQIRPDSIRVNILRSGAKSIPTFQNPSITQSSSRSDTPLPIMSLPLTFVIALHCWSYQRKTIQRNFTPHREQKKSRILVDSLLTLMITKKASLKGNPSIIPQVLASTIKLAVQFASVYSNGAIPPRERWSMIGIPRKDLGIPGKHIDIVKKSIAKQGDTKHKKKEKKRKLGKSNKSWIDEDNEGLKELYNECKRGFPSYQGISNSMFVDDDNYGSRAGIGFSGAWGNTRYPEELESPPLNEAMNGRCGFDPILPTSGGYWN